MKDKLIRSRSRAATPIGCVRPNICIRVIGLLGLEVSTKPGGDSTFVKEKPVAAIAIGVVALLVLDRFFRR
jgi:hypothetical protein